MDRARMESLEGRRLLTLIRPDANWGQEGSFPTLPSPPSDSFWITQPLRVDGSGRLLVLATDRNTAYSSDGAGVTTVTTDYARLFRFTPDGQLDPTYAPPQLAETTDSYGDGQAFADASGRVWVIPTGGDTLRDTFPYDPDLDDNVAVDARAGWHATRYDAAGRVAGTLEIRPARVMDGSAWASDDLKQVLFDSTGNAYAAVAQSFTNDDGTQTRTQILKFLVDGTPDTGFGDHGVLNTLDGRFFEIAQGSTLLSVDAAGKLTVVAGDSGKVFRYAVDGTPDTSFGTNGRIDTNAAWATASPYYPEQAIGIDPQGRFITIAPRATGTDEEGLPSAFAFDVRRRRADGSPDKTFGTGGVTTLPTAVDWYVTQPAFAPDGSMVLSGNQNQPTQGDIRLTSSGQIDADWLETFHQNHRSGMPESIDLPQVTLIDADGNAYGGEKRLSPREPITLSSAGTLFVSGSAAASTVSVTTNGGVVTASINGMSRRFSAGDVKSVEIETQAGRDNVNDVLDVPVTIIGSDGDDTLSATGPDVTIYAGAGSDTLHTGDGTATINLGTGDNVVNAGDGGGSIETGIDNGNSDVAGHNTVTAGRGTWSISLGSDYTTAPQTLTLGSGVYTVSTGVGDDHITADGSCSITDTGGDNVITTGRGDDTIRVYAGNSTIRTGGGDDFVRTYGGTDSIDGGDGDDTLLAGSGRDTILGGDGDDHLNGSGDDMNVYDDRDDVGDFIDGGAGNDTIHPGCGDDSVLGGSGDDTILKQPYRYKDYSADAGGYVPFTFVPTGNDSIDAGDGNDVIIDAAGDNTIVGGAGDDSVRTGDGADSIDGGLGRDSLRGGDGNDTLLGGGGRDRLFGLAGDDFLGGGGNADILVGGAGDDTLRGGLGDDLLIAGAPNTVAEAHNVLSGNGGLDRYQTEDDSDTLAGLEEAVAEVV